MQNKTHVPEKQEAIKPALLVSIVLMSACAPFGTDVYLPAFPAMLSDLSTSNINVQLTLTTFFIGAGVGQLFFGALSDHVGRRVPLLFGSGLCVVSSLAVAMAPNIEALIATRFAQGFFGAAGMVISRAIVADIAHGRAAARIFSLVGVVMGVAPIAAPILGSVFAPIVGWRGLFVIVLLVNVIALAFAVFFVPESNPREKRLLAKSAKTAGAAGLTSRPFLANALVIIFAFGVLMAYLSSSPFVYQTMIGVNELTYGLLIALNSVLLMAMSYTSSRLVHRIGASKLLGAGVGVQAAAIAALTAAVASGAPAIAVAALLPFIIGANGLIFGNATALALSAVPNAAGKGSAVMGVGQFALGAAVAPLVGIGGEHTAAPLAAVLAVCAVIVTLAYAVSCGLVLKNTAPSA